MEKIAWPCWIATTRPVPATARAPGLEDGFWAAGGLTKDGQQRAAVVKLDRDGDVVWTQTFSGAGPAAVRGLDQMADGRVVITGYQGGTGPKKKKGSVEQ